MYITCSVANLIKGFGCVSISKWLMNLELEKENLKIINSLLCYIINQCKNGYFLYFMLCTNEPDKFNVFFILFRAFVYKSGQFK